METANAPTKFADNVCNSLSFFSDVIQHRMNQDRRVTTTAATTANATETITQSDWLIEMKNDISELRKHMGRILKPVVDSEECKNEKNEPMFSVLSPFTDINGCSFQLGKGSFTKLFPSQLQAMNKPAMGDDFHVALGLWGTGTIPVLLHTLTGSVNSRTSRFIRRSEASLHCRFYFCGWENNRPLIVKVPANKPGTNLNDDGYDHNRPSWEDLRTLMLNPSNLMYRTFKEERKIPQISLKKDKAEGQLWHRVTDIPDRRLSSRNLYSEKWYWNPFTSFFRSMCDEANQILGPAFDPKLKLSHKDYIYTEADIEFQKQTANKKGTKYKSTQYRLDQYRIISLFTYPDYNPLNIGTNNESMDIDHLLYDARTEQYIDFDCHSWLCIRPTTKRVNGRYIPSYMSVSHAHLLFEKSDHLSSHFSVVQDMVEDLRKSKYSKLFQPRYKTESSLKSHVKDDLRTSNGIYVEGIEPKRALIFRGDKTHYNTRMKPVVTEKICMQLTASLLHHVLDNKDELDTTFVHYDNDGSLELFPGWDRNDEHLDGCWSKFTIKEKMAFQM